MTKRIQVEVKYIVNNETCTDRFTCDHLDSHIRGEFANNGTTISFKNGKDEQGRTVLAVAYRNAEKITRYMVEED